MADKKMTLVERLRNPEWIHGPNLDSPAELSKEATLKDMSEAANEIESLQDTLSDALNPRR
jgi:hypothetical protein